MEDSNISALRIENLELRRKIDDLETLKTELQQKHLKEVCKCGCVEDMCIIMSIISFFQMIVN